MRTATAFWRGTTSRPSARGTSSRGGWAQDSANAEGLRTLVDGWWDAIGAAVDLDKDGVLTLDECNASSTTYDKKTATVHAPARPPALTLPMSQPGSGLRGSGSSLDMAGPTRTVGRHRGSQPARHLTMVDAGDGARSAPRD